MIASNWFCGIGVSILHEIGIVQDRTVRPGLSEAWRAWKSR
jgi:hypothetical protein